MDYRNTEYLENLEDIEVKKDVLEKLIRKECPGTKNFYDRLNGKKNNYRKEFEVVYDGKCAYCGMCSRPLPKECFEVDHFICRASFPKTEEGKIDAGKLENLVWACRTCNRSKADIRIEFFYRQKLNPDNGNIAEIFERDEDFSIRIKEKYREDKFINEFYDKLKLGYQRRRIDYLFLKMYEKKKTETDTRRKEKLGSAMLDLLEIRNRL